MTETAQGVTGVEVFGFASWITSAAAFVIYILWAYTPESVLQQHAITYYPSKYWALALPAWVCVTVVFVYWVYESLNMIATLPTAKVQCAQKFNIESELRKTYFSKSGEALLPLVEIPSGVMNMILDEGLHPLEAEALFKERLREMNAAGGDSRSGGVGIDGIEKTESPPASTTRPRRSSRLR